MEQSPDPVSEPDAYRASLLAALGDDDLAVALGVRPCHAATAHRRCG